MSITIDLLTEILTQARVSSRAVAQLSTKAKNSVLLAVADALETEAELPHLRRTAKMSLQPPSPGSIPTR